MKRMMTLVMIAAGVATALAMEKKAGYDEAASAFRGSGSIGEWTLKSTIEETTAEPGMVTQGNGGVLTVERRVKGKDGEQCLVRETFTPDGSGVAKWEIEITVEGDLPHSTPKPKKSGTGWEIGEGDLPWSLPISCTLGISPKPTTRFWSAWDAPADTENKIENPLRTSALVPKVYTYGAARFMMNQKFSPWYSWVHRPLKENFFSIPIVTFIEPGTGGLSLMVSPEQTLLDMELAIEPDGTATFLFYRHRISKETPVKLTLFLKSHEDDWRPGIGWMREKFNEYFDPENPAVVELSGTASYSGYDGKLDVETLKSMDYAFNWRASFDWPYYGMFLPPVGKNEEWTPFLGQWECTKPRKPVTMAKMDDYSRRMNEMGFKVLDYFCVTEFGTSVKHPPAPAPANDKRDVWNQLDWRDGNEFLFNRLAGAIYRVPSQLPLDGVKWPHPGWVKTKPGGCFYSWEESVVVDCGEPVFRDFLLDQLRRHIENLSHSSGICIDRMDWLRLYNLDRDDGVSWYDGKPARSFVWSWNHLMDRMGPLMHGAGKVIFVSPITKRLEIMRHVDGFLAETDDDNGGMNGLAVLGMNKPTVLWRGNPAPKGQEDDFMQRRLHLGIYPMCPYPANDHGLKWDPAENRQPWVDYGAMMAAMKGKKWVLEPHCVEIADNIAQANLFETLEGWVVPVTFGKVPQVRVLLRNVPFLSGKLKVEVLHPGVKKTMTVQALRNGDVLEIDTPLHRGCAMLKITRIK
jgi:hypothetical protein